MTVKEATVYLADDDGSILIKLLFSLLTTEL